MLVKIRKYCHNARKLESIPIFLIYSRSYKLCSQHFPIYDVGYMCTIWWRIFKCLWRLLNLIIRVINMHQGSPHSTTFFGLFIEKLVNWCIHRCGEGSDKWGTLVHSVLCVFGYLSCLQNLNAIHGWCDEKGLTLNLGKTEAMSFLPFAPTRWQVVHGLSQGQVEGVEF